jgi:hypothetical protein
LAAGLSLTSVYHVMFIMHASPIANDSPFCESQRSMKRLEEDSDKVARQ